MSEEDELTEDEKFEKEHQSKAKIIHDKDGTPMICLDEPVMRKSVLKLFPFSNLMDMKTQDGMKKVMEELRNKFAVPPNQMMPFERFDIFIIDLRKPKEEEDDCESE